MKVKIIMGSKSDLEVGEKAVKVLKNLDIPYEITVSSAHRTPERTKELCNDADVFITIAGLSAALPGVVASYTIKPVIGVPVSGKVNLDSLLSIAQMPPGIPVATIGLDRGDNAALLAAEILAISDDNIKERLNDYREKRRKQVKEDGDEVESQFG
ncbi:MAG: 5-(carboxyamino)imidazole ribonucleotide mutase [Thermoplasmata archaeon]